MKYLVLLFLVGCASAASLYDAFDSHGLEVQANDAESADFNIKDIFEKLKDSITSKIDKEKLKEKIEELFGKGNEIAESLINFMNNEKTRYKEKLLDLIDRYLGYKDRRSLHQADFNLREIFQKLKKSLLSKIDKEKLKAKVEELFGKGSEMADALLEIINDKGDMYRKKLVDLIDRYLGGKERRSLGDYWQKVKDYFKDLKIDLQEKYMKFGEWVKEVVNKGLDKGRDKMDNIKEIAREFIDHAKGVSKEVAVEALEFLRPYKEDLGGLYDQVKDTVRDILNRKE